MEARGRPSSFVKRVGFVFLLSAGFIFALWFKVHAPASLKERTDAWGKVQVWPAGIGMAVGTFEGGEESIHFYGDARTMSGSPAGVDSVYEVGSITKAITGLILARAIEHHWVTDETRIDSFRKEWKNQKRGSITLGELATHRSGLPRLPCNLNIQANPTDPYADYSEQKLIEGLTDRDLQSNPECHLGPHPSEKTEYSNWGFSLLGYVLGIQHGGYANLLSSEVVTPLGLQETFVVDEASAEKDSKLEKLIQGHGEKNENVARWRRNILLGSGALLTSPRDLMKLLRAIVDPSTTPIEEALKNSLEVKFDRKHDRMAYGWNVLNSGIRWKNGASGGFMAHIEVDPKLHRGFFYLLNSTLEPKCFIEPIRDVPCQN
jgi:CubicO group peptidase (beta-lactamase class C family)